MTARAQLPMRSEVRVMGRGKRRLIRLLYVERCGLSEICAMAGVSMEKVSKALRWKAGDAPLAARRAI